MNYYRRYVGDYLRDTSRLSMLEHGAYNLLLDYYYAEERPISIDLDEVNRMVRALMPEERRAVIKVLGLFFTKAEDGYRHKRVDHEIEVSKTARANGKHGGRPVTGMETGHITGSETGHVGGSGHPPTTNHQPPTTTLQPTPVKAARAAEPDGFAIMWKSYPKRVGANPRKRALRAYIARVKEGHAPAEILDGVARYAKFLALAGKVGTEYVQQAATFLGPDKGFLEPWTPGNGNGAGEWWKSEGGTLSKGKELNLPARPGESMQEYRDRIRERIAA